MTQRIFKDSDRMVVSMTATGEVLGEQDTYRAFVVGQKVYRVHGTGIARPENRMFPHDVLDVEYAVLDQDGGLEAHDAWGRGDWLTWEQYRDLYVTDRSRGEAFHEVPEKMRWRPIFADQKGPPVSDRIGGYVLTEAAPPKI